MTEERWLACEDPTLMLEFLRASGTASLRQRMLLSAAIWRRLGSRIPNESWLDAAGFLEACVEGRESLPEAEAALALARQSLGAYIARLQPGEFDAELAYRCRLFRDVCGNPFRPAALDASVLAPAVVSLARSVYDERALPEGALDGSRLAMLAEELAQSGCTDADLLSHLRSGGPHVRGCWALDLILGKE